MTKSPKNTALDLLRAAERLFVERGVDAVSLREIAAAAGQRNHSAALYHFGDKRSLLNALLARHSDPIAAAWEVELERMHAEGRASLEALVGLMVGTLVAQLDDPDGGPEYLIIVAQLVNNPNFPVTDMPATQAPGILALSGAMMGHIDTIPPQFMALRMLGVAALLYGSIAAYHRLVSVGMEIERDEFVADLVASMVGLLRGRSPAPGP